MLGLGLSVRVRVSVRVRREVPKGDVGHIG